MREQEHEFENASPPVSRGTSKSINACRSHEPQYGEGEEYKVIIAVSSTCAASVAAAPPATQYLAECGRRVKAVSRALSAVTAPANRPARHSCR